MRLMIALFFVAACYTAPPAAEPPPPPVDVDLEPGPEVNLLPPPEEPEEPHRERRRMDLDQLDATILSATGGIGWTESFEELASTLGKPDFATATQEDLEPSALFQKFLGDAARTICSELITTDALRRPEARTFFVRAEPMDSFRASPDRVEENLIYLLLRFHGRRLSSGAPELEPWLWMVRSVEQVTSESREMWRTLCIALMIHPDFYTY